jgi:TolB-like protein
MTENLIARLSKVPGLHVPSAPAAFIFKGRQAALAEMAKNLGVAYVLDGSVRKAGARLRVSARLMRADNGHVLWSETYDRPFGDLLMVQDDIVSDVSKTLAQSFDIQQ